jgi:transaldolase
MGVHAMMAGRGARSLSRLRIRLLAAGAVVKIPVTNTCGLNSAPLVRELSSSGVKLNVTAPVTPPQVQMIADALDGGARAYLSVFAGRIADTGIDPPRLMAEALRALGARPQVELIRASPWELRNVFQADDAGCHIITATGDILRKLCLPGKDLTRFSLETVAMFHDDAMAAGYTL